MYATHTTSSFQAENSIYSVVVLINKPTIDQPDNRKRQKTTAIVKTVASGIE